MIKKGDVIDYENKWYVVVEIYSWEERMMFNERWTDYTIVAQPISKRYLTPWKHKPMRFVSVIGRGKSDILHAPVIGRANYEVRYDIDNVTLSEGVDRLARA